MVPTIKFVEIHHRRHVIGQTSSHLTPVWNRTKPSTIQFTFSPPVAPRIGGNISPLTPLPLVVNIAQIICSTFRRYRWSEVLRIMS